MYFQIVSILLQLCFIFAKNTFKVQTLVSFSNKFINVASGRATHLTSVYESFAFTATRRKLDPNLARKLRAENGAVKDGLIPAGKVKRAGGWATPGASRRPIAPKWKGSLKPRIFINGAAGRDSALTSVYQSFAFTATRKLDLNLAKRLRVTNGAIKTACLPYPSPKL